MIGTRTRRAVLRHPLYRAVEKATRSMTRPASVRAAVERLEGRVLLASTDPIISEFMADNTTGLVDGNGKRGDWIEIYNPASTAIDLAGWHLTDTASNVGEYTFPSFVVPAGGYRIVFATGETTPYVDGAGYPHTNFALAKGGEYLALAKPDGTITSDYGPQFPPQTSNVSYGIGPAGSVASTLLDAGAAGRSLTPTSSIGNTWTGAGYADGGWTPVTTGLGFEANGLTVPALTEEIEGNNDRASANNATTSFVPYSGSLYQLSFDGVASSSTDSDYFNLGAMQAGDVLTVAASARASTVDPIVEIYGAGNPNPLASDDNNGPGNDSLVKGFAVPSSGTYYVRVRPAGTTSGAYRLAVQLANTSTAPLTGGTATEVESNDTPSTATSLENTWRAVNYQHHLAGGTNFGSSEDWFRYQFTARDFVSVVVTSPSADATVSIRDSQGNVLVAENGTSTPGGANDTNSYVYSFVVPSTGVYYVQTVKAAGTTATGQYSMDVYLSTQTPPPHPAMFTGQYATSVQSAMYNKNASTYLRVPFTAPDPSSVSSLTLRMKYEDGFVAYLNGVEVARRNAPGTAGTPLSYGAAASSDRAATLATAFEDIDISAFRNLLVGGGGNNVLAVQGLNSSASSDDFLIVPQLKAAVATSGAKQFFYLPTPGQPNIPGAGVVINEIHYDPDVKTTPVEFVELYNNSTQTISLAGWQFTKGISYTFGPGTNMAPGQYLVLAENAAAFQAKFGFAPFGQYSGALANDGEMVRLTDAALNLVDEVTYAPGFPWPTVGDPLTTDGTGPSIQLINAGLDNDLGGDWRSALPTPGAQNSVFSTNAAPAIRQVNYGPSLPTSNQPVTITAKVTDPDGVASVNLLYQVNAPGQYVPSMLVNTSNWTNSHNPAYDQNWVTLPMYDDGTHGDATPGDGVYAAQIPPSVNQNRTLVRYKVTATDVLGASITGPYADDPQLNFAYFVYDGVPGWSGAAQPGVTPVTNFSAADMSRLQVYQLIARNQDVIDAQHIPPSTAPGYTGNIELWRGAFYYNGIVYDNVGFRTRGGSAWRYAMGKNKFQLNFNRNHGLRAYDNYGRPYKTTWDNLTLNAIIQQGNYWHRGEQGMFEAMNLRLWQLVGVPANDTHWVQLRVVDGAAESTSDQYTGDLWGMYLAMEQNDGNFLDEHGLPDGNYYRMNPEDGGAGGGTLNNQGPTQPSDNSDLVNFVNTYKTTTPTDDWWRQNVNLDEYYAYRTIVEAVHHYDIDQSAGKNWFYYHNPVTNQWEMHPWDSDLTWANNMYGGGDDPFKTRVLPRAAFNLDYKNKIREIRDLLFNTDQAYSLLQELSNVIDPPGVANAPVDWDRDMWDYNPIMIGYTYGDKGGQGRFYAGGPSGSGVVIPAPGGFQGMVQKMRNYVVERAAYLDTLDADTAIPNKPTLSYTGTAGYPVDQLSFHSSSYASPVGAGFASMRWRIAEVYDPNNPTYSPTGPRPYEITATWQSSELTTFNPDLSSIPANKLLTGHTYRVRVEFKDATGRWSNWSDPVQLVAGEAAGPITALRVTELMYHPAAPPAGSPYTRDDFEYVELLNTSAATLDLSGVTFTSGIDFTFPDGFTLAPGQRTLVVSNLAAFQSRYGNGLNAQIAGAFANGTHLSDSGERIRLAGPSDQTILDFTYSQDWYPQTDGDGFSLVVINPAADPTTLSDASTWRVGQNPNGAPGAADPGFNPDDVVINELLANPGTGRAFIEIRNTTGSTVDLSNWFLSDSTDNLKKFKFAPGTTIAAGGLLTLYADTTFGVGAGAFALSPAGGTVYLTSADAAGNLLGFRTNQAYDASDPGVPLGRYVKSTGGKDFTALTAATPGAANAQPRIGPVVITEVMYNPPAGGNEYVELRNTTGQALDISGWQTGGITFTFAPGTIIPAHGYFLVVPIDPAVFRSAYNVPAATPVFGPFAGLLDDGGERVDIRKPGAPVNGVTPYVSVDAVNYGPTFPWPTSPDGAGASLQRISQQAYGNDVANWAPSTATGGTPGRPNVPTSAVASYDATSAKGKISATFAEDVSGTLTAGALSLQNRSGGTTPASSYVWDPVTLTATWTFSQVPADGNYRATLAAAGVTDWSGVTIDGDADGQAGGDLTLDFFFLNGDATRDRVVNFDDLLILAKNYNKAGQTFAQGDFTGDGVVNFDDLLALAKNYNKTLPAGGEPVTAGAGTMDFSAAYAAAQAAAASTPSPTSTTSTTTTTATTPPATPTIPPPTKASPPSAPKPRPTPPPPPPSAKRPTPTATKKSVPDLPPVKVKAPARPAPFGKAKIR